MLERRYEIDEGRMTGRGPLQSPTQTTSRAAARGQLSCGYWQWEHPIADVFESGRI